MEGKTKERVQILQKQVEDLQEELDSVTLDTFRVLNLNERESG